MIGNLANILSLTTLITFLLFISLAAFLIIKNSKSPVNISFSLVCLSAAVWCLNYSIAYKTVDAGTALFWFKLGYVGVIFISITYFHFAMCFLKLKRMYEYSILNYLIGGLLVIILLNSNILIDGLNIFSWGRYPRAGKAHPMFLLYFFGLVNAASIYIALAFVKKKKIGPTIRKEQLKYILFAFSIFTINSIDFIPNYGISIIPLGFIPATIFMCIIVYSIVKFRLMDISVVITRTSIFIAVYSFILGTPFLLAFGWQEKLRIMLGDDWWMAPLFCMALFATGGPFVYLYIQKQAEARLFQEQRRYQATLRTASMEMGRIKDLNKLLEHIISIIKEEVRIASCRIYLGHEQTHSFRVSQPQEVLSDVVQNVPFDSSLVKYLLRMRGPIVLEEIRQLANDTHDSLTDVICQMEEMNGQLVVPMFLDERMIAVLVVGNKNSGKPFNVDDLHVFMMLANQSALAIENAQFYDDIKRTHEKLFQAEKLAYVGQLASSVFHEIRNPLTAIKTYMEYLPLKYHENGFREKFHALIPREMERIERLLNKLLKLARPVHLHFKEKNMNELIDSVLDLLNDHLEIKRIVVKRSYALHEAVPVDTDQMRQALINLILNAVQAMEEEGTLTVQTALKQKPSEDSSLQDTRYQIIVSDTGCGMSEEQQKNLFTPFYTTKKEGIGLGLINTYNIIREHRGKISVTSQLGTGTAFKIELP